MGIITCCIVDTELFTENHMCGKLVLLRYGVLISSLLLINLIKKIYRQYGLDPFAIFYLTYTFSN